MARSWSGLKHQVWMVSSWWTWLQHPNWGQATVPWWPGERWRAPPSDLKELKPPWWLGMALAAGTVWGPPARGTDWRRNWRTRTARLTGTRSQRPSSRRRSLWQELDWQQGGGQVLHLLTWVLLLSALQVESLASGWSNPTNALLHCNVAGTCIRTIISILLKLRLGTDQMLQSSYTPVRSKSTRSTPTPTRISTTPRW